jgi:uncharacterized oligopeptide transporter (OPT) family protein
MACLFLILILLFPRVVLAVLFLFTNYLNWVFHNQMLVLIFGFLFLPITTLVYAWMMNSHVALEGINLVALIIAALLDLGLVGGGVRSRRSKA